MPTDQEAQPAILGGKKKLLASISTCFFLSRLRRRIYIFYFEFFENFQDNDGRRRTLPNDATGRFRPWPGSSIFFFHVDKTRLYKYVIIFVSFLLVFFFFFFSFLIFIVVPHGT